MRSLLDAAVFNNVQWCDGVCRALGRTTSLGSALWINVDESPPFYPNAVTLIRDTDVVMACLRELRTGGLPAGWAVKDCYAALDLASLAFEVLFDAEWLALWPDSGDSRKEPFGTPWHAVSSPEGLAAWEAAWRQAPENALPGTPEAAVVFGPALATRPDVRFLAAPDGRARAIANRSDDGSGPVVGISNLVLPEDDPDASRARALAAVRSAYPGLPVVSYESGAAIRAMTALGFERLGPLRIWVTEPHAMGTS